MDNLGIATIIISLVALLISVISLFFSQKYNLLVMGQVEMQIRKQINYSRRNFEQIAIANGMFKETLDSAIEEYLNSYNEACQKYIDKKVDRKRFRKSYEVEIRNIVKNYHSKYGAGSEYNATKKVHDDWFNLEK